MAAEDPNKENAQNEQAEGTAASPQDETSDQAEQAPITQEELEAAVSEAVSAALAEQRDSVLRAQAEVQNMRRRCEMDVEKAHKYALEKFASSLLSVADNLERALQAVPDKDDEVIKPLVEGVELTLKGLVETFAKFDVVQVNPEGEPFDPQVHEAMSMVPNPDMEPNSVMSVVQKGYTLNGRVLRPAMVIVSKAP